MADVVAMWKMLNHILFEVDVNLFVIWYRLMLLPDVFLFVGRCYCQSIVVDVKTTEADDIACYILFNWLMLLPMHLWQMLSPPVAAWEHVIYG